MKKTSYSAGETPAVVRFMNVVVPRYRRYASAVLSHRHFAEGRDGLLPVQRRVLWSMHQLHVTSRSSSTKTAKAAGYTSGTFHPHGDLGVATSIANMSQARMKYPLIAGIGNFGWHDAPPGAPRYTSCYLSEYAMSMLDPSELTQVPMDDSYDGKAKEPRFLPARVPHLLVGGCSSIAPGYSGNIPPCEPDWLLNALQCVVHGRRVLQPTKFAYRWGGDVTSIDDGWLDTGTASAQFAPKIEVSGNRVLVTTLAPGLRLERIYRIMSQCSHVGSVSEETPEDGELVRVVCAPRRGGDVGEIRAYAVQHLTGRESYSFLYIRQFDEPDGSVGYQPVMDGPEAFLRKWVRWRTSVVSGAARHRASQHEDEAKRIRLLVRAIDSRKRLLTALDGARSRDDLAVRVSKILSCTVVEAHAVIEVPFYRLAVMNKNSMLERAAEHDRGRARDLAIAKKPVPTMLTNAEQAVACMEKSRLLSYDRPKVKRRDRRKN